MLCLKALEFASIICCFPAAATELSTQQTHQLFEEFVTVWNAGQLPLRFYQGLAAAPIKRTSYSWQFKSKQQTGGAAGAAKLGMAAYLEDQEQQ